MLFKEYDTYTKVDIVKDCLCTIAMTAAFYIYWLFVLMLASIILINVWKTSLVQLCIYAAILTAVSAAVYIFRLVRKRRRGVY